MEKIVQLRAAKIPVIGFFAIHYWWVIINENKIDRWEIWQRKNVGNISWGHLHKNLMRYDSGVGNGNSWLEYQWEGETAELLTEIIENSPNNYPYNNLYLYWPGPNSNTFVQYILNEAKINYFLSPLGIGKDFLGLLKLKKWDKIIHFSNPLFGFKFMFPSEFELHIFTLTFGFKTNPFSLKLPFLIR